MDDLQYIRGARNLATSGRLAMVTLGQTRLMMTGPVAVVMRLTNYDLFAITAIFVLYHLLLVALTFWLGLMVHGPRAGLIAAGLVGICPLAVAWAATVFPDIPVTAFSMLSVALLFSAGRRAREHGTRAWRSAPYLLAGLALGLGYMVKETALVMIPFCLLLIGWNLGKLRDRRTLLAGAAFLGGMLLVLLGESAALSALARQPVFRPAVTAGARQQQPQEVRDKVRRQGIDPVRRLRLAGRHYANDEHLGLFRWAMVGAVMVYPFLRRRSWQLWAMSLWMFLCLMYAPTRLTYYQPPSLQARYFIFAIPPAAILLAAVVDSLGARAWPWASRRLAGRLLFVAVAAALACAVAGHSARRANRLAGRQYVTFEAAGTRQALDYALANYEEPVVLSRWLTARMAPMFYGATSRRVLLTSAETSEELAQRLLQEHGRFLYLDSDGEKREGTRRLAPDPSPLDELLREALAGGTAPLNVDTGGRFSQFRTRLDAVRYILGGSYGQGSRREPARAVYVREVTAAQPQAAAAGVD